MYNGLLRVLSTLSCKLTITHVAHFSAGQVYNPFSSSQKSASLQAAVCSLQSASLQVCKSASLQVCKSASLQVCKSASLPSASVAHRLRRARAFHLQGFSQVTKLVWCQLSRCAVDQLSDIAVWVRRSRSRKDKCILCVIVYSYLYYLLVAIWTSNKGFKWRMRWL